ncbi:calcium/sodium antiporter [Nocardioidaceae bacterium]|nr:calcium/sodium antiporter [Nocardioidaceae bacterium]
MDIPDPLLVVLGLGVLVLGGDLLVRGATGIARHAGLSTLVTGLTVVAFATSAPEMAVSVDAVLDDRGGLAVGNVVGSNIALVLLILGSAAVLLPLLVQAALVRVDLPVLVAFSVALLVLALDGNLSRLDGLLLLAATAVYLVVLVRTRGDDTTGATAPAEEAGPTTSLPMSLLALAAGLALLVGGARALVAGAAGIASSLGVSDLVIGLTVVAIGTSVPELVTVLVAVAKGDRDMAVGNVVGSGIANIGLVLGVTGLVAPDGVPVAGAAVALDIPLMLASAVVLIPIAFTGLAIARWEGALFLALYVAYTAYVLLDAADHDALRDFELVMVWFVLPLLGVVLVALTSYELGRRRGGGHPLVPR